MDYLYENLGDERFQEFCSALISKEFNNIQVYPVGQSDGGRDTIAYSMDSINKEFVVFQVKFVRNANQERDIHKWLNDTIKGELPKINKLIPKGATRYYLLTNVRGTAHLDSGSKDIMNKTLEENINIPTVCWWREDLNALFEKDPLFKWSFPEILNGQDILNSFTFEGLQENKDRRNMVIKAYLTDQFEIENEVKFKQIDLQNKLLTLYTDVPLRVKKINPRNKLLRRTLSQLGLTDGYIGNDPALILGEMSVMPAAEFLLNSLVQQSIDKVLLEGGPGQGKSTISQYICQVHRARLLEKTNDVKLLPETVRNSPTRLPFKIDLRDLASWIEKKNPYEAVLSEEIFLNNWKDALESFLVSHILYHSKIEGFNSSDLGAIVKSTPIVIVFDGFDEIANLQVRSDVIEFVNRGLNRLSAYAKSIQVIITSRPAAFTDSIGFSINNYPHFELTEITLPVITEYVEKWIKASKLEGRDASDLRRLVKEKLEMPHLKDLAKSPMQLAIFISLLRTKGQSLPNKRTALYDNYIELFFDRESEKNALIRDKRDLIIDIHEYLAWVLHSEAELYKNSGSISFADINKRLKEYLSKEGHDTTIADKLFDVMRERVCALVSRVQGTFEFEVQPLREYFCAKYLYKSAPHSASGENKSGTKPDRFNAILRSFYWQNVVRFFAGCADAGELDMIIQEIKYLQEDEVLRYTDYPRIITAQILSDYVFTQKPLKLREVVKIIVDGINIGAIINQDNRYDSNEALQIPVECGRKEVIEECFKQLNQFPKSDYCSELIAIINNNPLTTMEYWSKSVDLYSNDKLTRWLEYGYQLKLIYKIEDSILLKVLHEADTNDIAKRLQIIIDGNRQMLLEKDSSLKQLAFQYILQYELTFFDRKNSRYSLHFLSLVFNPHLTAFLFKTSIYNLTLLQYMESYSEPYYSDKKQSNDFGFQIVDQIDEDINKFYEQSKSAFELNLDNFKTNLEPWNLIIENARTIFGDTWLLKISSIISAATKTKETYEAHCNLNDNSVSLCKRVRHARMKSGNVKYWQEMLAKTNDLVFTLLVFFTWATPKAIIRLLDDLGYLSKSLDKDDYLKLTGALSSTTYNSSFNKKQEEEICDALGKIEDQDELKYIISLRFESGNQKFVYTNINKLDDELRIIRETKYQFLLSSYLKEPHDKNLLKEIKDLYPHIEKLENLQYYRHYRRKPEKIPYDIAKIIMEDPKNYPQIISSAAEKTCRFYANENLVPVGKVAESQNWFEN